jgi:hypothetical protein
MKTTSHLSRDWTHLPFASVADAVDGTWRRQIAAVLGAVDSGDDLLLVSSVGRRHIYTAQLSTPVPPSRSESKWQLPLRLLLDVGGTAIAAGNLHLDLEAVGTRPQGTHAEVRGTINWYQSAAARYRTLGRPPFTIDTVLGTYLHGFLTAVDHSVANRR